MMISKFPFFFAMAGKTKHQSDSLTQLDRCPSRSWWGLQLPIPETHQGPKWSISNSFHGPHPRLFCIEYHDTSLPRKWLASYKLMYIFIVFHHYINYILSIWPLWPVYPHWHPMDRFLCRTMCIASGAQPVVPMVKGMPGAPSHGMLTPKMMSLGIQQVVIGGVIIKNIQLSHGLNLFNQQMWTILDGNPWT